MKGTEVGLLYYTKNEIKKIFLQIQTNIARRVGKETYCLFKHTVLRF